MTTQPDEAGEGTVGLKSFGPKNGVGAGGGPPSRNCARRGMQTSQSTALRQEGAEGGGAASLPSVSSPGCLSLAISNQKPEGKEPVISIEVSRLLEHR